MSGDDGQLCACGCGTEVAPGKTWRRGHSSRRRVSSKPSARCPICLQVTYTRADGTLGAHWMARNKRDRNRCPQGGRKTVNVKASQGRRVTVTIDVVVPHGWFLHQYAAEAGRVLREHAVAGFVVSVDAEEAS